MASPFDNLINSAVSNIQSFAQQRFAPAVQQVGNFVNQNVQNFQTQANSGRFNIPQQAQAMGQLIGNTRVVSNGPTLGQVGQDILHNPAKYSVIHQFAAPLASSYAQNQVIKPWTQGLGNLADPHLSTGSRLAGGVQAAGAAFNATPAGMAFTGISGGAAGTLKAIRTGQPIDQGLISGVTHPTSIATQGLGINNPLIATGVDLALTRNPKNVPADLKSIAENPSNIGKAVDAIKFLGNIKGEVGTGTAGKSVLGQANRTAMHPQDIYELDRAVDTIRGKTSTPEQKQVASNILDTLAQGYLTHEEISNTKGNPSKIGQLLQKRAGDLGGSSAYQIPGLGFAGKGRVKPSVEKNGLIDNTSVQTPPQIGAEAQIADQPPVLPQPILNNVSKVPLNESVPQQGKIKVRNPDMSSSSVVDPLLGTPGAGTESVQSTIGQNQSLPGSPIPQLPQLSNPSGYNAASSLPNDTMKVLSGAPVKEKTLVGRMKVSDKYAPEVSQMLQGTYVPQANADTINIAKQAVRADPQAAELRAMNPRNAADQAIGAELFNYHMDNGNIAKANEVLNATSGTNEGQMVQILSQYDKTTPQGAIKFASSAVKQYNLTHPNSPLTLTDSTIQSIYDKAKSIQSMPQGRERNIASNELMNTVNGLIPSSFADKALTLWKAGLLTSLRTHERNLLGNAIHGTAEVAKDIPASIADIAMSARTGQRSTNFTLKGLATGAKEGLASGKDILTKGYDPTENITKYDVKKINWGNSVLGKAAKVYTESVFRPLNAADRPFYSAAYTRSLQDQAQTASINAGKSGGKAFMDNLIANPTTQMLQTATKDAEVATFHNQTGLSKVAQTIQQAKVGPIPVGQIVAPFTGVPSAVAGQMVAYSPIGLVKGIATAGKVVAQNVPELQRQAAQEIGRGVMGTGLFALGSYLASKGLMTGQPKDPQEAAQWQLEGRPANSIMIGGKWRSIGSIGPESLVALAGSKAQQELGGVNGSIGSYAGNLGKDFMGQTFLQGMSAPLNAITDPARYGPSFVGNLENSVIPNIVKDASKAGDPYQRENNNLSINPMQNDYVTNSIPGLRNQNVIKRDALGNPLPQEPTGAGAFTDLFNSKTPISNPVVNELGRLNDTGNNATPSKPGKAQTINGFKQTLNPQQLNALEAQFGPQTTQALQQLIQSKEYQSLPDSEKANAINSVVSSTRKQVRGVINLSPNGQTPIASPMSAPGSSNGVYTLVDPATGNVKKIDLSQPIQQPTLTGLKALDTMAISKYNSAISSRANDIYSLYQSGKITQSQAGTALQTLSSQKILKAKKPKKGKKLRVPKMKKIKQVKLKVKPVKLVKIKS